MLKRYISQAAVIAAAAGLSAGCGSVEEEPSADALGTRRDAISSVVFYHDFHADSFANGQCNNGINVYEGKGLGEWTTRVDLDTDSRSGGCQQTLGIVDPQGELSGLTILADFQGDGVFSGNGQCGNPGSRLIPVTGSSSPVLAPYWGINTDGRSGGCVLSFSLSGRSDVALDVKFEDENYNGQCRNTGLKTVTSTTSASIIMDMDDRSGGCFQSFRLRKMSCGDTICDPGESCEADCVRCGDGICNGSETELSCARDCSPATCGDGICEPPETRINCRADCGPIVECVRPPPGCL
ncbi:hypothetical protein [Pyxidicoccus xibeiensis]|uniref:hypothetical protein n=1 Tax=Pyxidicoccus xibeiensis TaxID=2906759 RepID=UPI0020A75FEA|nr:hypothetical protein [Pyxidicoccus xibeiensis]MCP3139456.1 hypothetical protein [Pyxidicoccus xibeiensis]